MQTDRELLRDYAENGDEAAFSELVRRHLGLVYSAAARQAGGNTSVAEDATQTVFIILAREARRLARHETLVGWLHTCVRYTTLRSLRDLRRRQARELKALAMDVPASPNVPWEQVRPLLDAAVAQLNEPDREAVLLRYFQNRSHREVGEALGLSEDAARLRVDRALEKLRRNFARRGIFATGAVLGESILANAVEAEPAGLIRRVSKSPTLAVNAVKLGWGGLMLRIIFMTTKNKIAIAALVILIAGWFSLTIPRWNSSPASGVLPNGSGQKTTAVGKNAALAVQAPRAAAVPASQVTNGSVATNSPQPLPGLVAPPAPPPPGMGPGGARGASFGPGNPRDAYGNIYGRIYGNLFLKLKLTAEQQQAFITALTNKKMQSDSIEGAALTKLSTEQIAEVYGNVGKAMNLNQANPDAAFNLDDAVSQQLGITDKLKAISDTTNAQLRQLLGSDENFQSYQTYASEVGIRQWVMNAYGNALEAAGVPALTTDQQDALVGIVANNTLTSPMGLSSVKDMSQVVRQAAGVLAPEQTQVMESMNLPGVRFFNKQP